MLSPDESNKSISGTQQQPQSNSTLSQTTSQSQQSSQPSQSGGQPQAPTNQPHSGYGPVPYFYPPYQQFYPPAPYNQAYGLNQFNRYQPQQPPMTYALGSPGASAPSPPSILAPALSLPFHRPPCRSVRHWQRLLGFVVLRDRICAQAS